jgi:8-oxo-dGTP pyrophosphatase MutT (NUDIX family)
MTESPTPCDRPRTTTTPRPFQRSVDGKRRFACFPAAVVVFLIDADERFLLLEHPARPGLWEVVNGGLEHGECILAGALRELSEEAGPLVKAKPLGTVHASSFHFDDEIQFMISISYAMLYEGGPIEPGDDMTGSRFLWKSLPDIEAERLPLLVPSTGLWPFRRALEVFRLWRDHEDPLQPDLSVRRPNKYERALAAQTAEKSI